MRVLHAEAGFSFNTIDVMLWFAPKSSVSELGLLPPSQYVLVSLSFAFVATNVCVLDEALIVLPIAILLPDAGVDVAVGVGVAVGVVVGVGVGVGVAVAVAVGVGVGVAVGVGVVVVGDTVIWSRLTLPESPASYLYAMVLLPSFRLRTSTLVLHESQFAKLGSEV
ncbi:hypothetical protein D3C76_526020 [compost metagenome]